MASAIRRLLARAGLARHDEMEERFSDEMRFHLDMHIARNVRAGMSEAEAKRAALVAFGGAEPQREAARDAWGNRAMDELRQDLRFGMRTLRGSPVFTAAAVTILAIGIGATTIIGSVVDQILLRPLPYPDADRLVVIQESIKEVADKYPVMSANASHFLDWQQNCRRCDGIGAARSLTATLTTAEAPQEIPVLRVTPGLLSLLGVRPAVGRAFSDQDEETGARVALVSHGFWQRQLGGEASALGRTITMDGVPTTVVGILPGDFFFPKGRELGGLSALPEEPDVLVPMAFTPRERRTPGEYDYRVIARLATGATLPQLTSEIEGLQRATVERTGVKATLSAVITPMQELVVREAKGPLTILLAAVAGVLLIVWTNLANLLMARNVDREREAAVRVALGAGRRRLVRQALTESVLLAALGGALGLTLSFVGLSSLLRLAPADVPRLGEVGVDGRALLMGLAATVLTGIAFGVIPALRFGASDPGSMLRGGGRTATATRRHARQRDFLIGAQVAISVALLATTGLLLSSFVRVLGVDRGFSATQVLAADVALPRGAYPTAESRAALYGAVLDRLRGLPGAPEAAISTGLPLEGERQVDMLSLENDTRPMVERPVGNILRVSPSYAATIGLRIVRGRMFDETDRGRRVVVLSESAARLLWNGEDALGRRVVPGSNDSIADIIGVAADVRTTKLEDAGAAMAYLPHWTNAPQSATIVVRSTGDAAAMTAAVRGVMRELAPTVPLARVRTLETIVDRATAQRRFQLLLIAFFGLIALVTAAVGMYAMISYALSRRSREIAIRMAVGATKLDVHRLALREGFAPVIAGLVVGIVASIGAGRAVSSMLFEASPGDPVIIGIVSVVMLVIGALACLIPARRAAAAGTAEALRMA